MVNLDVNEVPGVRVTLDTLSDAVKPDGTISLSVTLPVNPVLVSVTFARAEPPASKVWGVVSVPLMVKFAPTVTSISVE